MAQNPKSGIALEEAEREQIRQAIRDGGTRNSIAKKFKRSPATISKVALDAGLTFDRTQTAIATEAFKIDAAARRAALADKMLANAEKVADQMFAPTTYFDWGGKDHDYDEKTMDEPTPADKLKIAQIVATSTKVHIDLIDRDSGTGVDTAKSMLAGLGAMFSQAAGETSADNNR